MEERVVGGKDKKYVLYTVVGEEKGRAGAGVWVVRVLLCTLLLVALAVVPYVSLRLAQVNDRTLVVFQPVPVHNHSSKHHHREHPNLKLSDGLKSASLTLDNHTTTQPPKSNVSSAANETKKASSHAPINGSTIVTIHESAVTLSVLEDTNATKPTKVTEKPDKDEHEDSEDLSTTQSPPATSEVEITTSVPVQSSSISQSTADSIIAKGTTEEPEIIVSTVSSHPAESITTESQVSSLPNVSVAPDTEVVSTPAAEEEEEPTTVKESTTTKTPATSTTTVKIVSSSSESPSTKIQVSTSTSKFLSSLVSSTTLQPSTTSTSSSTYKPLAHKLVYIATTASGNHVGGFAVWKTDKTPTDWAYFYENIPIEYQSHQDQTDHEMRGSLAAVRTWSSKWQDYHLVLRSHHSAIEGSHHPTRKQLIREIETLSEGHFTYELEWRTRKNDKLVAISYCLSRLHKDFKHWFHTFQSHVDDLLGKQDWTKAKAEHRTIIEASAFDTDPVEYSQDTKFDDDQERLLPQFPDCYSC